MMSFAAGDCEGFELLYRRHSGSIYRFFYFGTHGDKSLAAELFHDVWMTVVRGRMRYTNDINFADWLYHSAWARLHDHLRLHALDRDPDGLEPTNRSANDEVELESEDSVQTGNMHDVVLSESEADSSLIKTIRKLSPEQKEVVLLRYCFSMSTQDIADFIDIGKSTVDRVAAEAAGVLRQNVEVQQSSGDRFNG